MSQFKNTHGNTRIHSSMLQTLAASDCARSPLWPFDDGSLSSASILPATGILWVHVVDDALGCWMPKIWRDWLPNTWVAPWKHLYLSFQLTMWYVTVCPSDTKDKYPSQAALELPRSPTPGRLMMANGKHPIFGASFNQPEKVLLSSKKPTLTLFPGHATHPSPLDHPHAHQGPTP